MDRLALNQHISSVLLLLVLLLLVLLLLCTSWAPTSIPAQLALTTSR